MAKNRPKINTLGIDIKGSPVLRGAKNGNRGEYKQPPGGGARLFFFPFFLGRQPPGKIELSRSNFFAANEVSKLDLLFLTPININAPNT